MEITHNSTTEATQTVATPATVDVRFSTIEIEYDHTLYLYPNNTPSSSLISIQLTIFLKLFSVQLIYDS